MLIIPPSPYKNMKKWQYKVRNYLNITTSGNHYGWPMKKSHFLLRAILEGAVSWTNYSPRPWIFVLPIWLLYFIQNIVYRSFYCCGWRSSDPQKLPTSTRKFTPHSVDSMSTWLVSEKFKHLSVENFEGKIQATYSQRIIKVAMLQWKMFGIFRAPLTSELCAWLSRYELSPGILKKFSSQ